MNKKTYDRLKNSGWHEERHIDISGILKKYKERNFEVSEDNKKFLESYGLLEFNLPNHCALFDEDVNRHFNPIKALGKNLYKRGLEYLEDEYEFLHGGKIIPIGENDNRNMLILCTDRNEFYGYTDGCLVKYGDTIEEMLECVIGECRQPYIFE